MLILTHSNVYLSDCLSYDTYKQSNELFISENKANVKAKTEFISFTAKHVQCHIFMKTKKKSRWCCLKRSVNMCRSDKYKINMEFPFLMVSRHDLRASKDSLYIVYCP